MLTSLFQISCYMCCSIVFMLFCCYCVGLLFVLFCVLFVCTVPLPPGVNPIAVNKLYQSGSISLMFHVSLHFCEEHVMSVQILYALNFSGIISKVYTVASFVTFDTKKKISQVVCWWYTHDLSPHQISLA